MAKRLMEWDPTLKFSVSATTRKPREGEEHGVHYWFHDHAGFRALVDQGGMLEHAEVFGNHYGSPRAPVEEAMAGGRDTLFDVDWQGGQQIRNSALGRDAVSVFILPPSILELDRRLRARGQDSEDVIAGRMAKSRDEISHWAEYDYVLINDDQDACFARLQAIVVAERLKRERQPDLSDFVRALNREFEER
ncbi:Guanylate kinase [Pseudogemmobacter humi]|uniref:Guanylate kinase n=2 Tax=Pseudogemmobacter humi TaxID=2483812 RepID=A0A3P5X721_9RHOB|nr:Guanylate kinase [Pseudogemmobacter humi]